MRIFKVIGKVMVFSILVIVVIIEWTLIFLVGMSSVIVRLLSSVFFAIAVLSLIFGVMTWAEAFRPTLAAFIIYMIPIIEQGILVTTDEFNQIKRSGIYKL